MAVTTDLQYENLVFEGGGVRGYAYAGAIKQLDEMGHLQKFKRFAGTSVGSLFAAMLAIGFTSDEILRIRDRLHFASMEPAVSIRTIFNMWNLFGMNNTGELEKQVRNIITDRVNPEITLSDLFKMTGKELVIVTTCLNREKPVYLHHHTFPNVRLLDAIIASVSVPIAFQPRKFDWLGEQDYYVDGGIVENYPIWVFNDIQKLYDGQLELVDKNNIDKWTLGMKLLGKGKKNNIEVYNTRQKIEYATTFITELVNTLMIQVERSDISKSYIAHTIPIKTGNVAFLDFSIDTETVDFLIKNGHTAVFEFLTKQHTV
jgi:predicted acylesterase/phospholipase RssA